MDKIIGIGNALVDILARVDSDAIIDELHLTKGGIEFIDEKRLTKLKEMMSSMQAHKIPGGSAGNTIRALAILGSNVGFIGKIGDDEYGKFYKASCEKAGIEPTFITGDLPTGVAVTYITPDGERTFADYLGSAATLTSEDLTPEMLKDCSYLYIEGYLVQNHEMILKAAEMAKQQGLQICIDLASYNVVEADKGFFRMLLTKYVDIVFSNEEEAKAFTGEDPENALNDISQLCSVAIVKMGKKGSIIKKGTETIRVEAITVDNVIDTTGAGDYFAAGFLYGLTSGYSFAKCAQIGSLLASKVISVIGTELKEETWECIKSEINAIVTE